MKDMYIIILIVLSVLLLSYLNQYLYNTNNNEHFTNLRRSRVRPHYIGKCNCKKEKFNNDFLNDHFPLWNSTRHTRNMSWDIRGDVPIRRYYISPFYNSQL